MKRSVCTLHRFSWYSSSLWQGRGNLILEAFAEVLAAHALASLRKSLIISHANTLKCWIDCKLHWSMPDPPALLGPLRLESLLPLVLLLAGIKAWLCHGQGFGILFRFPESFFQLKISSLDPINTQPAHSGLPQIDAEGKQPVTPHLAVQRKQSRKKCYWASRKWMGMG